MLISALQWIDRFHWLILFLFSPWLLFPTPKRSLALLIVPLLWVVHVVVNRYHDTKSTTFPITPLNLSLLILTFMVLLSLGATFSISFSLEKISGFVLGLGVYFSFFRLGKDVHGWLLSIMVFLVGGFAWSLLSFFSMDYEVRFNFLAPVINRVPQLLSNLPGAKGGLHHNAVGGTLLWFLPLYTLLAMYFFTRSIETIQKEYASSWFGEMKSGLQKMEEKFQFGTHHPVQEWLPKILTNIHFLWFVRFLLFLVLGFMAFLLVLTQSRGSFLALGLTIIAILFIVVKDKWKWYLLIAGLIVIGVLVAVLSVSGGWKNMIHRMGLSGQAGFSINTLKGRVEIWQRALKGIQDFPFTGMGMNTFREVFHVMYPSSQISPDIDIAHAHNEFLQVALDLGLLGLIAFISVYIILFWILNGIWRSVAGVPEKESNAQHFISGRIGLSETMVLGLGGGLFAHMLFGMTDAIALGAKPGIFYWMLLALVSSMHHFVTGEKCSPS